MKAIVHIVDDEPKLLKMIGVALDAQGYEIEVSTNGTDALKKIAARVPDLIILDVMMPGMDGIEVCQKLRSDPKTANTPIIFLSALVQVEDKIAGLKAGADEYLTKPIDTRELVVRVEAILNRMESLRSIVEGAEAETIGFMGVKGGVGTTTVALNIACALCRKDQNILAVELRSYYGSFAHHLALASRGHLGEILWGESGGINERDLAANIAKHSSGLALLNSPPAHIEGELEQGRVSALLTRLARDWEYIVLDLPGHPSDVHRPALEVTNFLFLILEPAPDSVSAGKQTLEYLRSLPAGVSDIGCIVVNRASMASSVTAGEIEAALDVPVIRAIPQAMDALIASQKVGLPLVRAQPEHQASMVFKEIAAMIADKSLVIAASRTR